ncbi:MAG: ABC transporter ATP-binding protein [Clostridium sp.]|nr:ABC transporter ATP-binding protein [Clostridium sp.]MCI7444191.1 ABC transporter ATP-binding protein [Clostridium sp.]
MKIEIKNLHKSFKDKKIFEDFNLTLDKNINVILGRSGGGKSTLLNILSELIPKDSGEIVGVKTEEISYVFQEDRLIPWLTIKENMELFIYEYYSKEEGVNKFREVLKILDILEVENKYPESLSGGMRQRVNIARALLKASKLILMDEPFKSLDYKIKYMIMEKLKKFFKEENSMVIFVTHDIDEAIFMGDEIIVLGDNPLKVNGVYNEKLIEKKNEILNLI